MGDPDKGFGPGATWWLDLPDDAIFGRGRHLNVGAGLPGAQKSEELKKQMAASIPVFNCPTRRRGMPLSARYPDGKYAEIDTAERKNLRSIPRNRTSWQRLTMPSTPVPPHTWYSPPNPPPNGPPPTATGCGSPGRLPRTVSNCLTVAEDLTRIGTTFNGISTRYVGAKLRQITDGTSKTALVGEKSLVPKFYELATEILPITQAAMAATIARCIKDTIMITHGPLVQRRNRTVTTMTLKPAIMFALAVRMPAR